MKQPKTKHHLRLASIFSGLLVVVYGAFATVHTPALNIQPTVNFQAVQSPTAQALAWPSYGQAAVGAEQYGVLAEHGDQTPVPTASTAKIMTALAILRTKPLAAGQAASPIITLTQADVDIYNSFVAKDGSVALVAAGEQISEYQALQALLLPSANNMADSLAIWAFGSTDAYVTYANQLATELGLKNTHIADASGFSPATVSTASDLVKLSLAAMNEPVFADIVSQSSATIPVAGKIYNVNGLLGRDNIIGIKTGNTDQAGGVFVIAGKQVVNGQTLTVVASVMGGPNLVRSMLDSVPLLTSARQNFGVTTVVPANTLVGTYTVPWAGQVELRTARALTLLTWNGSAITTTHNIRPLGKSEQAQAVVGNISASTIGAASSTPVVTATSIPAPSLAWRLRHPW